MDNRPIHTVVMLLDCRDHLLSSSSHEKILWLERIVFEMCSTSDSILVGVHARKRGRMEQKTKMQQSHRVVTHRNSTHARATTRSCSPELGRHVVARKLQEGYLVRVLVALIQSGVCYRYCRIRSPGGTVPALISYRRLEDKNESVGTQVGTALLSRRLRWVCHVHRTPRCPRYCQRGPRKSSTVLF